MLLLPKAALRKNCCAARIPDDFEYSDLTGLTLEAREKLARIRPKNLGQAGRIPGVSPSDVAQLSIALAARK